MTCNWKSNLTRGFILFWLSCHASIDSTCFVLFGRCSSVVGKLGGKQIVTLPENCLNVRHSNVIKWNGFSHFWAFLKGHHRSLLDFPHKGESNSGNSDGFSCFLRCWFNHIQQVYEMTKRHICTYILYNAFTSSLLTMICVQIFIFQPAVYQPIRNYGKIY